MATTNTDYRAMGSLELAATNIEIVKDAYRHRASGDFDGFSANFADDAIAVDPNGLPYGGVYGGGRQGLLALAKKAMESFEVFDWEIQEFGGGGDIVFVHIVMTFKPKGKPAYDHPIVELWRFRDRKVVEFRVFYFDTKLVSESLA